MAIALAPIDETQFRSRYFAIDATDYGFDLSEDDFGYTWEWFQNVREVFGRAAVEGMGGNVYDYAVASRGLVVEVAQAAS